MTGELRRGVCPHCGSFELGAMAVGGVIKSYCRACGRSFDPGEERPADPNQRRPIQCGACHRTDVFRNVPGGFLAMPPGWKMLPGGFFCSPRCALRARGRIVL